MNSTRDFWTEEENIRLSPTPCSVRPHTLNGDQGGRSDVLVEVVEQGVQDVNRLVDVRDETSLDMESERAYGLTCCSFLIQERSANAHVEGILLVSFDF